MKYSGEEIHFVPEISFYRYWSKQGGETTRVNPWHFVVTTFFVVFVTNEDFRKISWNKQIFLHFVFSFIIDFSWLVVESGERQHIWGRLTKYFCGWNLDNFSHAWCTHLHPINLVPTRLMLEQSALFARTLRVWSAFVALLIWTTESNRYCLLIMSWKKIDKKINRKDFSCQGWSCWCLVFVGIRDVVRVNWIY